MSKKIQLYTVYFIYELLYMFRVVSSPIIRSTNNCICSIWHQSTVVATSSYRGGVQNHLTCQINNDSSLTAIKMQSVTFVFQTWGTYDQCGHLLTGTVNYGTVEAKRMTEQRQISSRHNLNDHSAQLFMLQELHQSIEQWQTRGHLVSTMPEPRFSTGQAWTTRHLSEPITLQRDTRANRAASYVVWAPHEKARRTCRRDATTAMRNTHRISQTLFPISFAPLQLSGGTQCSDNSHPRLS